MLVAVGVLPWAMAAYKSEGGRRGPSPCPGSPPDPHQHKLCSYPLPEMCGAGKSMIIMLLPALQCNKTRRGTMIVDNLALLKARPTVGTKPRVAVVATETGARENTCGHHGWRE